MLSSLDQLYIYIYKSNHIKQISGLVHDQNTTIIILNEVVATSQ